MSPVTAEGSETPQQTAPAQPASGGASNNQLRIVLLVIVAALVVVGVWLAISLNSDKTKKKKTVVLTTAIGPKSLSFSGLREQASHLPGSLYWIGPKRNNRYEFTRTTDGHLFVRYLPKGVGAGRKKGQLLIVATYPYDHPYKALQRASKGSATNGKDGNIIVPARPNDQKSVLVAWPHGAYEVEVYHPVPGRARDIAASGALTTVG